jgi:hypothetical protein
MKKISLTLIGLYLLFLHGFSQVSDQYSNIFKAKKLKLEEVNLVTSYYTQDGNHSAVTGGIGTEKLTDYANMLELKLVGYGETGLKHTILAGMGIDHHTAASQKWISATGASSQTPLKVAGAVSQIMIRMAFKGVSKHRKQEFEVHNVH